MIFSTSIRNMEISADTFSISDRKQWKRGYFKNYTSPEYHGFH